MLTKVRIYNEADEYLELPLGLNPALGGYAIRSIDGLGPVKAEVSYSNYALLPGGVFHSANTGVRNIVIRAGYEPNYSENQTVQSMRKALYSIAMPGRKVKLYFYDDGVWTYWIDGYVETHEPLIFTNDPEVQISIICVDTDFANPNVLTQSGSTGANINVDYLGSAPRGFTVFVTLTTDVSWVQVRRTLSPVNHAIVINKALVSGSRVRIQLTKGSKRASLINSSGVILENLTGYLSVVNDWPELTQGNNVILVNQSVGSSPVTLEYRNHYLGI